MAATAKKQAGPVSFPLGRQLATPGALRALAGLGVAPTRLISRHAAGDWGDLDDDDKRANTQALADGSRLLSAYEVHGVKFWVITEADRSATTVILPEEY